jgi:hypothetical protein
LREENMETEVFFIYGMVGMKKTLTGKKIR